MYSEYKAHVLSQVAWFECCKAVFHASSAWLCAGADDIFFELKDSYLENYV